MSVSSPTQTSASEMKENWGARPGSARLVRVLVIIGPTLLTLVATVLVSRLLIPPSEGSRRILWWIVLSLLAIVFMTILDRIFRRLAPLSALLRISLVFPDEAPGRFAVALRAGNTKKVQKRIESIQASGIALTEEDSYASQMLEMVALLGEHDRLTRGHCERVRAYTELIIEEMGLPKADAERLRWAALLHDLGKLMVSADILNKDGRPTEAEWEELKTHPAEGAKLAEPIAHWLGEWTRAIGEHHERWDGGGYPAGLSKRDIHLGARIVSVADTYDVITSARSYKKPISAELARAEIARCAGTQFDPEVVRAFLSVGIGRLRFIAGPVAWLTGAVASVPTATVVPLTTSTVAGIVALAATMAAPAPPPSDIAFGGPVPSSSTLVPVPVTTGSTTVTTAAGVEVTVVSVPVETLTSPEPEGTTTTSTARAGSASTRPQTVTSSTTATTRPTTSALRTTSVVKPVSSATSAKPSTTARPTSTSTSTSTPPLPTARNDSASVAENGSRTIDVLGNDSSGLALISVSSPASGAASMQSGAVRYVHDGSETSTDSFTYTAQDAFGRTASATVSISVSPTNDVPTVTNRSVSIEASPTAEGTVLTMTAVDPDDTSHTWRIVSTTNSAFSMVGNELRLSDSDALTPGQTETINVQARDGGTVWSNTATITVTVRSAATDGLVISEFSANSTNSLGDFVEIYNSSSKSRSIGGLRMKITSHNSVHSDTTLNNVVLPSGGFYLLKKAGSSVAGSDQTFSGALPKVVGFELLTAAGVAIDAVGTRAAPELGSGPINQPSLGREGEGVPMLDPASTNLDQSMSRRHSNQGACVDTGNNSADFRHNFAPGTVTPRGFGSGAVPCGAEPGFAGTSGTLIISEFRTDGPGSGQNDFVEIYNPTGSGILLSNWTLENGDGDTYSFPNISLGAGRHFVVGGPNWDGPEDVSTSFSIKNGGSVNLLNGGSSVDYISVGTQPGDLPILTRRLEHSYSRKRGCQFTGNDLNDFEHLFISTPRTRDQAPVSCG